MTSGEFAETFDLLIRDLENWNTLGFEEKKTCLNQVEEMLKTKLGMLLTSSDKLEQLFLRLSHLDIRVFCVCNSTRNAYPFWQALSSIRSMKYLPDYKPLYLLMMDILCQIQGVKRYAESEVSYVNSDKSLNYQNICTKIESIFEQTDYKSKIARMLIVFRDHLENFLKLSGLDFNQVFRALNKNKFPKYCLSEKEQAWLSYSAEEKQWVNLCNEFKAKYQQLRQKHSGLMTLQSDIDELFSYKPRDILLNKQRAVYAFLSSPQAYPLLRCKEDMLSITEKIRHFILKCFGLARGNKEDRAYTLNQNTIFASKTHQLAFKIAEHIPGNLKNRT